MPFVGMVVLILVFLFAFLKSEKDHFKYSKTFLVLVIASIAANISLAQNYSQSLTGAKEGIAISNKIAAWIITDSGWGKVWSLELFKKAYDISTLIMVASVTLFFIFLLRELRTHKIDKDSKR